MKWWSRIKRFELRESQVIAIIIISFLLFVIGFVFWQKDFFFGTEKESTLRIAVVLPDNELIQQSALREGMEQAAFNYNCELNFLAPLKANDLEEQNQLIARQLESSPNALILNPILIAEQQDQLALGASKLPIFLVNSPAVSQSNITAISSDYRRMAQELLDKIHAKQAQIESVHLIIATERNPGSDIMAILKQSFLEQGLATVESHILSDFTQELIDSERNAAEEILLNPQNVIITLDSESLVQVSATIKAARQRGESAPVYAWNGGKAGMDGLDDGLVKLLVVDNQYSIGYLAVSNLAHKLRQEQVPESTGIKYAFIDRNNIDSISNQHLLYPIVQ